MKKIFTLLFAGALASSTIFAQSLQVVDKLGNVIANGSTILSGGPVTGTGVARLEVKNLADASLNVMAKKQELVITEGQINMFCWKNCYAPFVTNPEDTVVIEPNASFPAFTADFITPIDNYSTIEVRFTFFVAENPNDSISVIIKYMPSSFALKHHIHEISSGDVFDTISPLTGEGMVELSLTNLSSASADILVRRTDMITIDGADSYFCWKSCYAPNVLVTPEEDFVTVASQGTSENFSAHYMANNHFGSVVSRYTFFDKRNSTDSTWFYVRFTAEGTGVNEITRDVLPVAYPNPAKNLMTLDFSSMKSNGTVSLYNLTGSIVKSVAVASGTSHLSINVDDIPSGLYFYSLSVNGKTVSSRKIMIAR